MSPSACAFVRSMTVNASRDSAGSRSSIRLPPRACSTVTEMACETTSVEFPGDPAPLLGHRVLGQLSLTALELVRTHGELPLPVPAQPHREAGRPRPTHQHDAEEHVAHRERVAVRSHEEHCPAMTQRPPANAAIRRVWAPSE